MKNTFLLITTITLITFIACNKEGANFGSISPSKNLTSNIQHYSSTMRYAGSDYSQSITVDTANGMISSYLSSVNYPSTDTALRSLTFDADTLRAYLLNPNIVTLKFMFAHQLTYKNGGFSGQYAGMQPTAMTMVVVGLDNSDHYVLNNRNGVFEDFSPCPNYCPGNSGALINQ